MSTRLMPCHRTPINCCYTKKKKKNPKLQTLFAISHRYISVIKLLMEILKSHLLMKVNILEIAKPDEKFGKHELYVI